MPPKKDAKTDKKADADAPDPKQVIGAFQKDYAAQSAALVPGVPALDGGPKNPTARRKHRTLLPPASKFGVGMHRAGERRTERPGQAISSVRPVSRPGQRGFPLPQ
jgi:hypothetical protein